MSNTIKYVNPITGRDDELALGTVEKPFKTISKALSIITGSGYEINVVDTSVTTNSVYEEANTLLIEGREDLTIRFGNSTTSGGEYSFLKWLCAEGRTVVHIKNCRNIRFIGANFSNESNLDLKECITVEDSQEVELYDCHVSNDFKTMHPDTTFFKIVRSDVTLTNITMDKGACALHRDDDSSVKFIGSFGDSTVAVYSCRAQGYRSATIPFVALYCDQDLRSLTVNGLFVHGCESYTVEGSTGLLIDGDTGSIADFNIINSQFSHLRNGIIFKNLPAPKQGYSLRVASSTFFKCCRAIVCDDSDVSLYNLSIYGTKNKGQNDTENQYYCYYEQGIKQELDTIGVFVKNNSRVTILNMIVTFCNICFSAETNGMISVARSVFCDCSYFKQEASEGLVTVGDYVRATDPRYLDLDRYPYGYFYLRNDSPCVNTGKVIEGISYQGVAPNIGAIESDKYVDESDLPSILSRQLRSSETLKMTDIDVEELVVSGLKALDPDSAADREGSAIRDLFVKPIVSLNNVFLSELDYIRNNMSFQNIDTMSNESADALAANLIVTRRTGAKATGSVRLFFDRALDLDLPAEMLFTSSSGLRFYSLTRTTVSQPEMEATYDGNLYYVDIAVEGEETGDIYNIGPGEITTCEDINSPYLVLTTNVAYFSGGEATETNEELYERVKDAITTRCLNTTKGVRFQFMDNFSFIRRITVIGKGDPEMIRDDLASLLNGTEEIVPVSYGVTTLKDIHLGGKTDVYVYVYEPVQDSVVVEAVPGLAKLNDLGLTDKPILRIESIEICDVETQDTLGVYIPENKWELVVDDPRTRFSTREDLSLKIDSEYVGNTIKINYMWASEISAMQKWAEADDNRVVCEDILVKHHQPAFVSMSVAYHAAKEEPDMEILLEEFIKSIPEKKSLKVSDIVDYMYEQKAVHVLTPLLISAVVHKVDGSIERIESFDEVIIERTACFIPDKIEVTYLGEDQYS